MKKFSNVLLFLVAIVLVFPSFSVGEINPEDFVIKTIQWGDSKELVKKKESLALKYEEDGTIGFSDSVLGLECHLYYQFDDNSLYRIAYVFQEKHSFENLYISDFLKVRAAIIGIYGSPKQDDEIWNNSLYKDDEGKHGLAISIGHLIYKTVWGKKNTEMLLILNGDNYEINMALVYTDVNYKPQTNKDANKL